MVKVVVLINANEPRLTRIRDVEDCRFSKGKIKMLDFS